jgi:hypothetical protein
MDQPFGDCHAAKVRREAHRTAAEAAALPEKINFNAAPLNSASPKPNATWNARPPLFRRQSLNSFPALASNTVAAPWVFIAIRQLVASSKLKERLKMLRNAFLLESPWETHKITGRRKKGSPNGGIKISFP